MPRESDLQEMNEMLYQRFEKLNFAIDNFRDVTSTSFSFNHWQKTEYPDKPEDGVQKRKYFAQIQADKDGRLKSLKVEANFEYDKV